MKKHTTILCLLLTCLIFLGASVIGYQDWQLRGSAPGNPASGFFRVWADNTGQYFKCLTSSGTACYFDPKATSSTPGIVQTDGSTITNSSGTISCTTATTSQIGCVRPDGSTITISGGVISASGSAPALVLLEKHTASSSAELDFTTWYSSSYDDYIIEFVSLIPATNGVNLYVQCSTNGGSSYDTGNNYYWGGLWAGDSSSSNGYDFGSAVAAIYLAGQTVTISNTTANGGVSGSARLYDPGNTTTYKRFMSDTLPALSSSNNWYRFAGHGAYHSTSAVNAFRILFSSGNIASGTVRVYGLSH